MNDGVRQHHGTADMLRIAARLAVIILCSLGAGACRLGDGGRVDSTALEQTATGPQLRVVIIGAPNDPRVPPAREAVDYWNRELLRLGRRVRLSAPAIREDSIPDEILRGASREAVIGVGPGTSRLLTTLSPVPADIAIVLSHTDLISFGMRWRPKSHGVAGIRRSDIPPLSMPNTVRNVIAHEIGHVLGLDHNENPATLMCGRPAPCRPAAFASDMPRFFPLTADDDAHLRSRWP